MSVRTLRSYFEQPSQQRVALDALGDLFVSNELRIYEWSKRAFACDTYSSEAASNFQHIYEELAGRWQVFRPHSRGDCWSPKRIHRAIATEFVDFAWSEPITVFSFSLSIHGPNLRRSLAKMRRIKPNVAYPHMAVSKFLHFFNPALFPIYDTAMIWNTVFRAFKAEFRAFVEGAGIPYRSAMSDQGEMFLLCYVCWASSLMSSAHPAFMTVFKNYVKSKTATSLEVDPAKLYARAFEYTALGAAKHVLNQRSMLS